MANTKRLNPLTGHGSFRLTPAEDKLVAEAAQAERMTKSQWIRKVILEAVGGSGETRILLAEFMALRTVVLALNRESLRGAKLTDARINELIELAEAHKYEQAAKRLKDSRKEEKA